MSDVLKGSRSSNHPLPENALSSVHSYQENDPTVPQNSHSLFQQPIEANATSSYDYFQHIGDVPNTTESSRDLSHPLLENASSSVKETQKASDSIVEILFGCKEDSGQYILSGTEFHTNQHTHSFQQVHAQQYSEIVDTHPATIQSPDTGCNEHRESLSNCHDVGEKRCDTTQEMPSQTEHGITELSETPSSYAPEQRLAERNVSLNLGLTHEPSGNYPITFQTLHPSLFQTHPSIPNVDHTVCSTYQDMSGNDVMVSQLMNMPIYIQYAAVKHQDFSLQSLQNPGGQPLYILGLDPQGLQQFEINPNMWSLTPTALPVVMTNQSISNQCVNPSTPQPVTTGEIQGMHFPPKPVTQNNPNKRRFPASNPQQESKRGPSWVLPAASLLSTSRIPVCPVTESSSPIHSKAPNISSDHHSESVDSKKNESSLVPDLPNLSEYERVNIVVYGRADWTTRLLKPFSGGNSWKNDTPCKLAFEKELRRGPTVMNVSVWKTNDITQSSYSLRGFCSFTKTTIVILISQSDFSESLCLAPAVVLIRSNVSPDVPIILVNGKADRMKQPVWTLMGYRLKAKYNLSAFLDCAFGFRPDAENMLLTAIDVSFLKR